MRIGIWVLNIFAAIWAAIGLSGLGMPAIALPVLISAALIVWGNRIPEPPRGVEEAARVRRLVAIWSSVEGVAIFATFALCARLGLPDVPIPMLAIIVGLHFLPLARGLSVAIYYATGAAMIAVGAIALLLPAPERHLATGISCALILWASCLAIFIRAGRRGATVRA